jgi:hypothetical protein
MRIPHSDGSYTRAGFFRLFLLYTAEANGPDSYASAHAFIDSALTDSKSHVLGEFELMLLILARDHCGFDAHCKNLRSGALN